MGGDGGCRVRGNLDRKGGRKKKKKTKASELPSRDIPAGSLSARRPPPRACLGALPNGVPMAAGIPTRRSRCAVRASAPKVEIPGLAFCPSRNTQPRAPLSASHRRAITCRLWLRAGAASKPWARQPRARADCPAAKSTPTFPLCARCGSGATGSTFL